MARPVLLGYDLGTTRLKVAAFDLEGRLLGIAARRNAEPADGPGRRQAPTPGGRQPGR
jgi:sugar (pentulose or hexulose) kinase